MANKSIPALTDGSPAQSGDLLPISRSGGNFKVTAASLASSGILKTMTVPVSSNDILNLATTPRVIVAGQAGHVYAPISFAFRVNPGTKGYIDPNASAFTLTSVDNAVASSFPLTDVTSFTTSVPRGSTRSHGTITGGASNVFAHYLAVIAGFTDNPTNNGSFYLTASSATQVNFVNWASVTETHSGTALVGTTVYHGSVTGGDSDAFAGQWFIINSFMSPANNGLFYCVHSSATTLELANPLGTAETRAAIATPQSASGASSLLLAAPTDNTAAVLGNNSLVIGLFSPLGAGLSFNANPTALLGTLIPQSSCYGSSANPTSSSFGTTADGADISLYLEGFPATNLTSGDGTMDFTITYLDLTVQ
jgi:hypothetical protein